MKHLKYKQTTEEGENMNRHIFLGCGDTNNSLVILDTLTMYAVMSVNNGNNIVLTWRDMDTGIELEVLEE